MGLFFRDNNTVTAYIDNNRKYKKKSERFKYFLITVISIIVTILIVTYLPVRLIRVRGQSMEPTLPDKTMVVAKRFYNKKSYSSIDYGDIVITGGMIKLIKRVVALPGDEVEIKSDGLLYVNGKLSDFNNKDLTPIKCEKYNKVTLNDGEYYLLGDNRDSSDDSRVYGPFNEFSYKFEKIFGEWFYDFRRFRNFFKSAETWNFS